MIDWVSELYRIIKLISYGGTSRKLTYQLIAALDETLTTGGGVGGASDYRLGPFNIGVFDGQRSDDTYSSVTGGTFAITYPAEGDTTTDLAWNVSAANLKTALEALPSIGAKVVSVTGTDIATGYVIIFTPLFMTELVTWNAGDLEGPDAPYSDGQEGADIWTTELFTLNAGDTILDFHHSIKTPFDSGSPAVMSYIENPDNPTSFGPGWSSIGPDGNIVIKLNNADYELTNVSGIQSSSDIGYQRSVRFLQDAVSYDSGSYYATVPAVFNAGVTIYAFLQDVGPNVTDGEVWIWVDIAPVTAP